MKKKKLKKLIKEREIQIIICNEEIRVLRLLLKSKDDAAQTNI